MISNERQEMNPPFPKNANDYVYVCVCSPMNKCFFFVVERFFSLIAKQFPLTMNP